MIEVRRTLSVSPLAIGFRNGVKWNNVSRRNVSAQLNIGFAEWDSAANHNIFSHLFLKETNMKKFDLDKILTNIFTDTPANATRKRRGRQCRIEELEGREMLDGAGLGAVLLPPPVAVSNIAYFSTNETESVQNQTESAFAIEVEVKDDTATVSWEAQADADFYLVRYQKAGAFAPSVDYVDNSQAGADGNFEWDINLQPGNYKVWVTAVAGEILDADDPENAIVPTVTVEKGTTSTITAEWVAELVPGAKFEVQYTTGTGAAARTETIEVITEGPGKNTDVSPVQDVDGVQKYSFTAKVNAADARDVKVYEVLPAYDEIDAEGEVIPDEEGGYILEVEWTGKEGEVYEVGYYFGDAIPTTEVDPASVIWTKAIPPAGGQGYVSVVIVTAEELEEAEVDTISFYGIRTVVEKDPIEIEDAVAGAILDDATSQTLNISWVGEEDGVYQYGIKATATAAVVWADAEEAGATYDKVTGEWSLVVTEIPIGATFEGLKEVTIVPIDDVEGVTAVVTVDEEAANYGALLVTWTLDAEEFADATEGDKYFRISYVVIDENGDPKPAMIEAVAEELNPEFVDQYLYYIIDKVVLDEPETWMYYFYYAPLGVKAAVEDDASVNVAVITPEVTDDITEDTDIDIKAVPNADYGDLTVTWTATGEELEDFFGDDPETEYIYRISYDHWVEDEDEQLVKETHTYDYTAEDESEAAPGAYLTYTIDKSADVEDDDPSLWVYTFTFEPLNAKVDYDAPNVKVESLIEADLEEVGLTDEDVTVIPVEYPEGEGTATLEVTWKGTSGYYYTVTYEYYDADAEKTETETVYGTDTAGADKKFEFAGGVFTLIVEGLPNAATTELVSIEHVVSTPVPVADVTKANATANKEETLTATIEWTGSSATGTKFMVTFPEGTLDADEGTPLTVEKTAAGVTVTGFEGATVEFVEDLDGEENPTGTGTYTLKVAGIEETNPPAVATKIANDTTVDEVDGKRELTDGEDNFTENVDDDVTVLTASWTGGNDDVFEVVIDPDGDGAAPAVTYIVTKEGVFEDDGTTPNDDGYTAAYDPESGKWTLTASGVDNDLEVESVTLVVDEVTVDTTDSTFGTDGTDDSTIVIKWSGAELKEGDLVTYNVVYSGGTTVVNFAGLPVTGLTWVEGAEGQPGTFTLTLDGLTFANEAAHTAAVGTVNVDMERGLKADVKAVTNDGLESGVEQLRSITASWNLDEGKEDKYVIEYTIPDGEGTKLETIPVVIGEKAKFDDPDDPVNAWNDSGTVRFFVAGLPEGVANVKGFVIENVPVDGADTGAAFELDGTYTLDVEWTGVVEPGTEYYVNYTETPEGGGTAVTKSVLVVVGGADANATFAKDDPADETGKFIFQAIVTPAEGSTVSITTASAVTKRVSTELDETEADIKEDLIPEEADYGQLTIVWSEEYTAAEFDDEFDPYPAYMITYPVVGGEDSGYHFAEEYDDTEGATNPDLTYVIDKTSDPAKVTVTYLFTSPKMVPVDTTFGDVTVALLIADEVKEGVVPGFIDVERADGDPEFGVLTVTWTVDAADWAANDVYVINYKVLDVDGLPVDANPFRDVAVAKENAGDGTQLTYVANTEGEPDVITSYTLTFKTLPNVEVALGTEDNVKVEVVTEDEDVEPIEDIVVDVDQAFIENDFGALKVDWVVDEDDWDADTIYQITYFILVEDASGDVIYEEEVFTGKAVSALTPETGAELTYLIVGDEYRLTFIPAGNPDVPSDLESYPVTVMTAEEKTSDVDDEDIAGGLEDVSTTSTLLAAWGSEADPVDTSKTYVVTYTVGDMPTTYEVEVIFGTEEEVEAGTANTWVFEGEALFGAVVEHINVNDDSVTVLEIVPPEYGDLIDEEEYDVEYDITPEAAPGATGTLTVKWAGESEDDDLTGFVLRYTLPPLDGGLPIEVAVAIDKEDATFVTGEGGEGGFWFFEVEDVSVEAYGIGVFVATDGEKELVEEAVVDAKQDDANTSTLKVTWAGEAPAESGATIYKVGYTVGANAAGQGGDTYWVDIVTSGADKNADYTAADGYSFTVTGQTNTVVFVGVMAVTSESDSGVEDVVVEDPNAVELKQIVWNTDSVTFAWDKIAGKDDYAVGYLDGTGTFKALPTDVANADTEGFWAGVWVEITPPAGASITYVAQIHGLQEDTEYDVAVLTVGTASMTLLSGKTLKVVVADPAAAPTNVSAVQTATGVSVSWVQSWDAEGYVVQYRYQLTAAAGTTPATWSDWVTVTGAAADALRTAGPQATSLAFVLPAAPAGSTGVVEFNVGAVKTGAETTNAAVAASLTLRNVAEMGTLTGTFQAKAVKAYATGEITIDLNVHKSKALDAKDILYYQIECTSHKGLGTILVDPASGKFVLDGLRAGQTYKFNIKVIGKDGNEYGSAKGVNVSAKTLKAAKGSALAFTAKVKAASGLNSVTLTGLTAGKIYSIDVWQGKNYVKTIEVTADALGNAVVDGLNRDGAKGVKYQFRVAEKVNTGTADAPKWELSSVRNVNGSTVKLSKNGTFAAPKSVKVSKSSTAANIQFTFVPSPVAEVADFNYVPGTTLGPAVYNAAALRAEAGVNGDAFTVPGYLTVAGYRIGGWVNKSTAPTQLSAAVLNAIISVEVGVPNNKGVVEVKITTAPNFPTIATEILKGKNLEFGIQAFAVQGATTTTSDVARLRVKA